MDSFGTAFAFVLGAEGSWSADPNDRGNWTGGKVLEGELRGTKYGISAAAYPDLDIENLTLDKAEAIYRADYWAKIRGDEIQAMIALCAFDCAVNNGPTIAIKLLQKTCGLAVDGIFGKKTLAAIIDSDIQPMVLDFLARRAVYYAGLAEFPEDGLGWMRRLFKLAAAAIDTA